MDAAASESEFHRLLSAWEFTVTDALRYEMFSAIRGGACDGLGV